MQARLESFNADLTFLRQWGQRVVKSWPQLPGRRPGTSPKAICRTTVISWSAHLISRGVPGRSSGGRQIGSDGLRRPRHPRLFRPTTWAAGVILLATGVAAAAVWSFSSTGTSVTSGSVAARVGPSAITTAQIQSEVNAILAVPTYRQALRGLGTISLSAPVSPTAVAAATGDPDDLLITFSPAKGTSTTRPFTRADLAASVLTRLLYVTSLEQVLAARHVVPTCRRDG